MREPGPAEAPKPRLLDRARSLTLGLSDVGKLLVVVYSVREPDIARVISAWKANRHQRV